MGWWLDSATDRDKEYLCRYLCTDGLDIAWTFIREAYRSVSQTSIIQMQVLSPPYAAPPPPLLRCT